MKMTGLHRYPNGVAFGGRRDVAIFKSAGDPTGTDTGVPQGCLALDYVTPALWVKTGPNATDWRMVQPGTAGAGAGAGAVSTSAFMFFRKDAEGPVWLNTAPGISSSEVGHVSEAGRTVRISLSLENAQNASVHLYRRARGAAPGSEVMIGTVSTLSTERTAVSTVGVQITDGDELSVLLVTGDNDIVVDVEVYA